jgi:hypothetical protein
MFFGWDAHDGVVQKPVLQGCNAVTVLQQAIGQPGVTEPARRPTTNWVAEVVGG